MAAKDPIILPVAEFAPDLPAFHPKGSQNVLNVLPLTPVSYGPFPGMMPYSGALTTRCQGAYACLDAAGNVYVFAGDSQDLWELVSGSTAFSQVSQSAHSYGIAADQRWIFGLFGQRVIAADFADALQSFLLGTSSAFADLANGNVATLVIAVQGNTYTNGTNYALTATGGGGSGFAGLVDVVSGHFTNARITTPGKGYTSAPTIVLPAGAGAGDATASITATVTTIAPKAKYAAVAKGFLLTAFTNDATNGIQPQRVWWPALNDPTNWPTPGTATAAQFQSDYNDIFGDGGWIQGIVGNLGGADAAVIMEHAVWRMIYVGPPAIFDFFPALGVKGCPAPGSIVQMGNIFYYLGEDGFYSSDGATMTPIGANRVDKYFFKNVDQGNLARIVAAVDPINKLVIWAAPFIGNVNGNPDHLLIYNWQIDRWAVVALTVETLLRSLTFGYSLDQLFTVLGFTIDNLPAPLGSRVWTGGKVALAGFDTAHKLNYFTGASLAATIDLAEIQPFPGSLALVKNTRPLVDGAVPLVAVGVRNRLQDPAVFGAPSALNGQGTCPLMANGRYIRGEITIPAGGGWSHCQGLEIEATPNGVC